MGHTRTQTCTTTTTTTRACTRELPKHARPHTPLNWFSTLRFVLQSTNIEQFWAVWDPPRTAAAVQMALQVVYGREQPHSARTLSFCIGIAPWTSGGRASLIGKFKEKNCPIEQMGERAHNVHDKTAFSARNYK